MPPLPWRKSHRRKPPTGTLSRRVIRPHSRRDEGVNEVPLTAEELAILQQYTDDLIASSEPLTPEQRERIRHACNAYREAVERAS